MYEKIIVAIDGSLSSLNALKQAFRIKKARITVVCVTPPYEGDLDLLDLGLLKTDVLTMLKEPCNKTLVKAEEIAAIESVAITTICQVGLSHETIVEIAQARGCDLIVMGRRGLGRIERALMGSVTARVIGFSPVDVLVVPQDARLGWDRILLATDGSEYSKSATKRATALAKETGGDLKVVSATDLASEFHAVPSEVSEKLCEWPRYCVEDVRSQALRMDVHPECMVREGKAFSAILDVADEHRADLIVIGSHGRTGLKRLLMGSVAERVIGHATCPVLVVKR
jgi:nucleotide-binding universal stress UspA family protein